MFLSMPSTGHNPNLTKSDQTFRCLVGLTSSWRGSGDHQAVNEFDISVPEKLLRNQRKADVCLEMRRYSELLGFDARSY